MFCKQCGTEIHDGENKCNKCNTKVGKGAVYCADCGQKNKDCTCKNTVNNNEKIAEEDIVNEPNVEENVPVVPKIEVNTTFNKKESTLFQKLMAQQQNEKIATNIKRGNIPNLQQNTVESKKELQPQPKIQEVSKKETVVVEAKTIPEKKIKNDIEKTEEVAQEIPSVLQNTSEDVSNKEKEEKIPQNIPQNVPQNNNIVQNDIPQGVPQGIPQGIPQGKQPSVPQDKPYIQENANSKQLNKTNEQFNTQIIPPMEDMFKNQNIKTIPPINKEVFNKNNSEKYNLADYLGIASLFIGTSGNSLSFIVAIFLGIIGCFGKGKIKFGAAGIIVSLVCYLIYLAITHTAILTVLPF